MDPFTLEDVYDKYCQMIYGIALQLSGDKKKAEEILVATFEQLSRKEFMQENAHCLVAAIIRLTGRTAAALHPNRKLQLKQINNLPITYQLLLEQPGTENYCSLNKLSRLELARKMHQEFTHFRELRKNSKDVISI